MICKLKKLCNRAFRVENRTDSMQRERHQMLQETRREKIGDGIHARVNPDIIHNKSAAARASPSSKRPPPFFASL